jgi:hypothetical protein
VPHGPGEARLLGLWTAGCLTVLLLVGVLAVGDLALQWPVFVVPLVWALVAARPRRRAPARPPRAYDADLPETREAPTLPRVPPERGHREW